MTENSLLKQKEKLKKQLEYYQERERIVNNLVSGTRVKLESVCKAIEEKKINKTFEW